MVQAWSWDGTSWTVQPVTLPAGSGSGELRAVSCQSATNCMAVGYYDNSSGVPSALTEYWNGSAWVFLPSPGRLGAVESELNAVSCASATECTAVGDYRRRNNATLPLAEQWKGFGRGWSIQATPIPAGATDAALGGVSCKPATSCTAVGWSTDSSGTESALAEHSAPKVWTIEATVSTPGAALGSVSCTSADNCIAVGAANLIALAEHWDGSTWSAQTVPAPTGAITTPLSAISCPTASDCTLVGQFTRETGPVQALAEHWNGSTWKVQQTAAPATHKRPNSISCTAGRTCTMVGFITPVGGGPQVPLSEQE
jgi:hypothetical protein